MSSAGIMKARTVYFWMCCKVLLMRLPDTLQCSPPTQHGSTFRPSRTQTAVIGLQSTPQAACGKSSIVDAMTIES